MSKISKTIATITIAAAAIFGATEEHGFQGIGRHADPAPATSTI